jgi:hypothetical protein
MDYSTIRTSVVCDYAVFEIRTVNQTQAKHVFERAGAGFSHVIGCDAETGIPFDDNRRNTTTSVFQCVVQDPKHFQALAALFDRLTEWRSFAAQPRLTRLEVALDVRCKGATVKELANIATDLYRFSTCVPGDKWYFYRRKGEGRHYVNRIEMDRRHLVQHFEEQWQLTDRESQEVDTRYHAYVKTRDGAKALLPSEYRARFEVTLKGNALPCTALDDLAKLDFSKLAGHFKFRRLADDLNPQARHALSAWSAQQLGRARKYPRKHPTKVGKHSGTSVFRGSTVADDKLNSAAYDCLRALTRGWRKTGVGADFPEKTRLIEGA